MLRMGASSGGEGGIVLPLMPLLKKMFIEHTQSQRALCSETRGDLDETGIILRRESNSGSFHWARRCKKRREILVIKIYEGTA